MSYANIKMAIGAALAGVLLFSGTCIAAPPAPQPATWMDHIVMVELKNLPKPYSCDDLWYKFRDVLWRIGARPDWKITTQRCAFSAGSIGRSPQVELHFALPQAVTAAQARWADVKVIPQTVTLQPDQRPHELDKSDCQLLEQIKDTLLAAVPVKVVDASLQCGTPEERHHGFHVSVQTLMPLRAAAADTFPAGHAAKG